MSNRSPWRSWWAAAAVVAAVTLASLAMTGLVGPTTGGSRPGDATGYVALGDSYTSGPLVLPIARSAPLDCLQSAVDYPHLVAASEGLTLRDESCSGAITSDLTTAQHEDQPPQFDSLGAKTGFVTIGIGGNDNELFRNALLTCSSIDAFDPFNIGAPCKAVEGDTYTEKVTSDAATLGRTFARIHALAPHARVLVVGYPDILPQRGNCDRHITLTSGDVAYLNQVEMTLDSTLRSEARTAGATYVDTFAPSIGHDLCQPESDRWVEPPIPSTDAAPLHPNAKGEAGDARTVEAALAGAGVAFPPT